MTGGVGSGRERLSRFGWLACLALGTVLLLLPSGGHRDDSDAQLYRVVARNLAEDHAWLSLRYLPHVHPMFREHLPFVFWPDVLAIRAVGEGGLVLVGSLYSLGTLALVGWIAQSLGGGLCGVGAMGILATTESFFVLGGSARLDPPLMLFATLSAVPLLVPGLGRRAAWGGVACAALAVLVKGPFGLLPWCAASLARAVLERRLRPLVLGAAGALLATAPAALFLLGDRLFGAGTWWRGYFEAQILSSALGIRTDGLRPWSFPLEVILGRFWPGLPLCLLGVGIIARDAWRHRPRDGNLTRVALSCALVLLFLTLPARKVAHHVYVAFPLLSVFGALALRRLFSQEATRPLRWSERGCAGFALCLFVAGLFGMGHLWRPRCVAAGPLRTVLDRLRAGTAIAVVSPTPKWEAVSALAAERGLLPAPFATLEEADSSDRWALVSSGDASPRPGWEVISGGGGWVILERNDAAPP